MDNEKRIREIESQIDVFHKQSNFFKHYSSNRCQALYDTLRIYEVLASTFLMGTVSQELLGLLNANHIILSDIHNLQDALNTAIKWIYEGCSSSTSELSHHLSDMNSKDITDFLIHYADPYSVIVDGYISYSRKQNTATIDGNKVVFNSKEEQLTSFLYDAGERLNEKDQYFSEMIMSMCMSPQFQAELNEFAKSIRQQDGRLHYTITNRLWDFAHDIGTKQWEATSNVPQSWEFDHFTISDFKKCWTALYSICLVHFFAQLKRGSSCLSQDDAVIVYAKVDLIDFICKFSPIDRHIAEEVIDFLTFDPDLLNTDIMYQPLVKIHDSLIITPNLILSSNPERNLIAVIQKKNDSKYSIEVNGLESIMIDELSTSLPEKTVICRSKLLSKELPDVDFAIFDNTSNAILISEIKWLIAADSTKEVFERQKDIDHGCLQIEAIMGYAMKDPIAFANKIFSINLTEKPDLFWCVVAKHDIRSTNTLVPVITQNTLIELIRSYPLSIVFHKIRNREYYKPLPADSYMGHKTVMYAGYEFAVPALVINKEYCTWE